MPALKSYEQFKKSYLKAAEKLTQNQAGEGARPPKEYDGNFDDYEPLNLSDAERKGFGSLRSATASSGFEYGVVIENGNVGTLHTSGLPDAVALSFDDYGEGLTVLHSHTNATTFSVQDFAMLFNPKVEKVGVVGYNGDAYLTYVGGGWLPSLSEFEADVSRIRQEANVTIMEDPDFCSWSLEERNYMAIREQAYRIARNYGWTIEGGKMDD